MNKHIAQYLEGLKILSTLFIVIVSILGFIFFVTMPAFLAIKYENPWYFLPYVLVFPYFVAAPDA